MAKKEIEDTMISTDIAIGNVIKVKSTAKDLKKIDTVEITKDIEEMEFIVLAVYKDNTVFVAKERIKLHLSNNDVEKVK